MKLLKEIYRAFHIRNRFFRTLNSTYKILDIGCGRGLNGLALRELYPSINIYGIDIIPTNEVPGFISYCKVDLDSESLPYPDGYFDTILFTHVIEHLQNPFKIGEEINRVLKKGGKIYIEAPNWTSAFVPSFGFYRDQHNPFNFFDDPTHIKPWTKQGFFEFLSTGCSLQVSRIGTVRSWIRVPIDIFIVIIAIFTRNRSYVISSFWNIFGWCIYGIAVKD